MNRFTIEETNLLSIYNEGGKQEVTANITAALPYMDADMRKLAARSAATALTGIVSYLTTGTSAYARSLFHTPCFASGFAPLFCPLIKCYMPSFTQPRISGGAWCAARPLRQAQTTPNIARIAGSALPTGRPQNA